MAARFRQLEISPFSPSLAIMEAFALLSRGGARFNKDRFKDQVKLFEVRPFLLVPEPSVNRLLQSTGKASTSSDTSIGAASLPTELDFFKYASGSDTKTRSAKSKGKLPAPAHAPLPGSSTEAEDAISVDEEDSSGDETSAPYSKRPYIPIPSTRDRLRGSI